MASEARFIDDLGASRAGNPANSPVGAISRRHGSLKGSVPFFIHAPDARRWAVYTPLDFNTPWDSAVYAVLQQFSFGFRC
jgi:hypothetical protein